MERRRLVGLWGVSAYFILKSIIVAVLASKVLLAPDLASDALETMRTVLPLLKRLGLEPAPSSIIALAFTIFGFVVAFGIAARQKWAAGYVVAYHGIALVRYIAVVSLLKGAGWDNSLDSLSSPYVQFDIVSSLLMVAYLLRPIVREEFGFS
jgi:hypothetical protein